MTILNIIALLIFIAYLPYVIGATYKIIQLRRTVKAQEEALAAKDTLGESLLRDPVTELPDWQIFKNDLHHAQEAAARYGFTFGVMYLDVDDFHVLTNGLGRDAGDLILKEVVSRIQSCVRKIDSVTRTSKDTFVILLSQLSRPEAAAVVVQRLYSAFSQPIEIQDKEFFITIGMGIAIYPADGQDEQTLLRNAEQALHQAKLQGKNVYQFFQAGIQEQGRREFILRSRLTQENFYQELTLYYQPVLDTVEGIVICMDANIRWHHNEIGWIESEELYQTAEACGKTMPMMSWILRSACQQLQNWRALGFHPRFLGIPVMARQLLDPHFVPHLAEIVRELKFEPSWLLLNIASHGLVYNEQLEKAFNMLNHLGAKIAVNDFGTGDFSFQLLKHFAILCLKLDASFINDFTTNERSQMIVQAMFSLAVSLNVMLIIKGVENTEQQQMLQSAGGRFMQGSILTETLALAKKIPIS